MRNEREDIAFVIHGGTIMAILDKYAVPHKDYYNWMAKNGRGFEGEVEINENMIIKNVREI